MEKCVMDIISDMKLTVFSLDSKEALTWIMLQVICMLVCAKRTN